jgi:hypothetical protein
LIGGWGAGSPGWLLLVPPLLLNGVGTGLFQVAYMDAVLRTLPPERRGVAGSIALLTRTLGVVGGATVLTLIFQAAQGAGSGFLPGFAATFRIAGLASVAVGLLGLALARKL